MQVHLVDGTYELFRYHYSPANKDPERGATRGVVASCLTLLEQQGVAAVMGSAFGAEGYARLSFATDLATIEEGFDALENFLKA